MFRWLRDKKHVPAQDLMPRLDKLALVSPYAACTDDTDARLLAMLQATDGYGFKSWTELIAWLESRVRTLQSDKANLQRQLAATQSFVRFRR